MNDPISRVSYCVKSQYLAPMIVGADMDADHCDCAQQDTRRDDNQCFRRIHWDEDESFCALGTESIFILTSMDAAYCDYAQPDMVGGRWSLFP